MIISTTTIKSNNEPVKKEIKPYSAGAFRIYFKPLIEKEYKIVLIPNETSFKIEKVFKNENETVYSFEINGEYYSFNEFSNPQKKICYINIPKKYESWSCYSIEI